MAPSFSSTSLISSKLPLFSPKLSSCKPPSTLKITLMFNQAVLQQQQGRQPPPPPKWSSLSSDINTHILKSLPKNLPPEVADPMHHLIAAAPPSVAPALCLAACRLVSGPADHAMPAACAIQLIHVAAHNHTQLLLNRRSYPGPAGIDLMTGDGLVPLGYEMVAGFECGDPGRVVRVILEMTRALGANGMVEGQLMEAVGAGQREWVWDRKGGQVAACGAACGAILGRGSEAEVERLRRFGMYIGIINEMTVSTGGSSGENVELLRSLARLELQGFDEERADYVTGVFLGLGYNN